MAFRAMLSIVRSNKRYGIEPEASSSVSVLWFEMLQFNHLTIEKIKFCYVLGARAPATCMQRLFNLAFQNFVKRKYYFVITNRPPSLHQNSHVAGSSCRRPSDDGSAPPLLPRIRPHYQPVNPARCMVDGCCVGDCSPQRK